MVNYYIFGVHSRGRTVKEYLRVLEPDMQLLAYLYDNDEKNPVEADGVPVIGISEADVVIDRNFTNQKHAQSNIDITCPVYIGTRGVSHPHIIVVLKSLGFTDIRPVTVNLDISMRNAYVEKIFQEKNLLFHKLRVVNTNGMASLESVQSDERHTLGEEALTSCCIYVAKSANDKKLSIDWIPEKYENILQVGCVLTKDKVAGACFFDNQGDNISEQNRQFCELTGLYWIWKHAEQDVVGLVHYRRHFLLSKDWENYFGTDFTLSEGNPSHGKILDDEGANSSSRYYGKADVILPVPLYVAPSLAANFRDRHVPAVWEAMMEALAEGDAEEAKRAEAFFETNGLYCPCNMLITRREILSGLCGWLFPILFKVQERIGVLSDPYQNRYPGFLSERLITFWFYEHREEYRIWFADKNFLQ